MFFIFNKLQERIANVLFPFVEAKSNRQRSNIKSNISVTPKSNFAIAAASLANFIGITRSDTFYRCTYDLNEIKNAADTDSYLRMAIKKYSELFIKSGYIFKGRRDEPIQYLKSRLRLMSYMSNNAFDQLLRETCYDLVKFSNAFWIKTRVDNIPFIKANGITNSGKVVGGYFRVDPAQMQIQFDDKGSLKGYKQVTPGNREKKFDIDDVIHFTFDREPGSQWGTPRWIAALEDIRILRKLEGENMAIAYRYAIPITQAQVGLAQNGMGGTKKEIDDTRRELEHAPMDGMLVTNERLNFKVIGVEGNAIDLTPSLSYHEKRVFSALNTSEAMMGRGGSKQDADSMEEQIHNAVKDNQINFAIQFQHEVITELLLEGGFNPIINEADIVSLSFNEINLDTKVKTENHIINKFQTNAITFEEMRNELGMDRQDVDESRLYANMIEQCNAMEQIQVNHENALELATVTAKLSQQTNNSSNSSGTKSTSSKTAPSRVRNNRGNGKDKKTGKANGSVKQADSPTNQHGTFSAKVKESATIDVLSSQIQTDGKNITDIEKKLTLLIKDTAQEGAKAGYIRCCQELEPNKEIILPSGFATSSILNNFVENNIHDYFVDIKKLIGNTTTESAMKSFISSQKYRLDYLQDLVKTKSTWYSYMKTCQTKGIKTVRVKCRENSRHTDHNDKLLSTTDFKLSDIPGYSANCHCYLEAVKEIKK